MIFSTPCSFAAEADDVEGPARRGHARTRRAASFSKNAGPTRALGPFLIDNLAPMPLVNVDHIATISEARKRDEPGPATADGSVIGRVPFVAFRDDVRRAPERSLRKG